MQSGCLLRASALKEINLKFSWLSLGAVWRGVLLEFHRPDACTLCGRADPKPSSKGLSICTMECVFWDLAAGTKGDKLVTLLILWGDIADQSLGQNNA